MKRTITTTTAAIAGVAAATWLLFRRTRSSYSLTGKVVLITGGSRGLGLVLARRFVLEGAKLVLLARHEAELAEAKLDLVSRGADVLTLPCDLLQRDQIERAVAAATAHFGRIDVLVNNAGVIEVGPLEHMQREDFERCLNVHFWAPYELVRLIVPEMRRHGGGRIVNISSFGGKVAPPHLAPYVTSKFALTGFSDAIRAELAAGNIHVTTVAPGLMRTGSHVQAKFKGNRDAEYAWFAVGCGVPVVSINAERAAAKIISACRRGQAALTLTSVARLAIAANGIAPSLTGNVMKLANAMLPSATTRDGNAARPGRESRHAVPSWITHLPDKASARNNELHRDGREMS